MKIAVIGVGYVGLVSSVCFAKIGHQIIAVDNNQDKINNLNKGIIPIYEPGLEEILLKASKNQLIKFTTDLAMAVKESEVIFIAVGTPPNEIDKNADLSFIYEAAKEIAKVALLDINSYKVIVTKSTVPVGTNQEIKKIIQEINPNLQFSVASNPEFLREGMAIKDFLKPDRIIIGVEDEKAKNLLAEIYQPLNFDNLNIVYSDIATAELIKYAANSFLAMKIAFINQMADLCEELQADIKNLSLGIGLDSRIGSKFLNPGPGFGGSCFPKDIAALLMMAKKNKVKLSLVEAVISSNEKRKLAMVDKIISACQGSVNNKIITILGLAFKGNTDDIRDSPALVIIKELIKKGAKIKAYDPEAIENTKKELTQISQVNYYNNPYQASEDADSVVIATEWEEFKNLDLKKLGLLLKNKIIIDLRNMLNFKEVNEAGFNYFHIGKK
jgi:UDPglucose 6-dehydrogenase